MWKIIISFVLLSLALAWKQEDPYGITVIRDNFEKVLESQTPLTTLFYSSSCQYSNTYKQLFVMAGIKLRQQAESQNYAIVDCDTQKQLCDNQKISTYPTLLQITKQGVNTLREQEFLSRANIMFEKQMQVQNVAKWLEQQPNYFVAVLQQQGMQAQKRLSTYNIVYLKQSQLYNVLLGYTRGRTGCWIFKYDKITSSLKKYICGSGFNPNEITENIQKFKKGELSQFIFNSETSSNKFSNERLLNYQQLEKVFSKNKQQLKVILYTSDECLYCRGVDNIVSKTLKNLPNPLSFYHYKVDRNEIPASKTIFKLPYLQLWIGGQIHAYEQRFNAASLKEFISSRISVKPLVLEQL